MASKFRYLKLLITKKRSTGVAIQMSEFQLLDAEGNTYTWASNAAVTSNPAGATNETAEKLIDKSTSTKLCVNQGDWSSTSSQNGMLEIVFDAGEGSPIDLEKYCKYSYYTANDEPHRDPITWLLYASNDKTKWEEIDAQSEQTQITTNRQAQAGVWGITLPLPDRKFQDGIVGSTNIVEGMTISDNPYEQLVNYTMLYDSGNECEEVTGGWVGFKHNANPTADYPYASNGFITANIIDSTSFSKVFAIAHRNGSSSGTGELNKISQNNFDDFIYVSTNDKKLYVRNSFNKSSKFYMYVQESNTADDRRTNTKNADSLYMRVYWGSGYDRHLTVFNLGMVKADDWQALCSVAGVSVSTMDALLTNSSALTSILNNKDAVNFMIAQCTGEFMLTAIQSSTFITALNSSPYKAAVQANEHWARFLALVA